MGHDIDLSARSMADKHVSVAEAGVDEPAEDEQYRPLSGLAVCALLLGVAALTALAHPVFWLVPPAAVLVGLAALRRIAAAEDAVMGRGLALAGLALGLCCGAAAATHWVTRYARLEAEADRTVQQLCAALAKNNVPAAHQFTLPVTDRAPADRVDWSWYQRSADQRTKLRRFVRQPAIRVLLALGDQAQVRHYHTERCETKAGEDTLEMVYAVSYTLEGRTKTFFMRVGVRRKDGAWEVLGSHAPYLPKALAQRAP